MQESLLQAGLRNQYGDERNNGLLLNGRYDRDERRICTKRGVRQLLALKTAGFLAGWSKLSGRYSMWVRGLGLGIAAALIGLFIVPLITGLPVAGGRSAMVLCVHF
jgi:hypothetical protein